MEELKKMLSVLLKKPDMRLMFARSRIIDLLGENLCPITRYQAEFALGWIQAELDYRLLIN